MLDRLRAASFLLALLMGGAAASAPMEAKDVPAPLRAWIPWALHGEESRFCPPAHDDAGHRLCIWPGQLSLSLDDRGGRFELSARTDAPGWLPLPGDVVHWPLDVTDGGRAAATLARDDAPALWLEAGEHRIQGRFEWAALPESLRVPPATGIVALSIGGKAVPDPSRDERQHVWLGRSAAGGEAQSEHLGLRVFRLIDDDVPTRVTTRIEIDAGGEVREEVVGPVLLQGLTATALAGDLPARLDDDGRLHVQVRPGQWSVTLEARSRAPVASLAVPQLAAPWPSQEVWSFQAHHDLRVVETGGLAPVDPRQTGTPEEWQGQPAFLAEPGATLALDEKQRGDPSPEPDQLRLSREAWLDFDGGGFTLQDHLTGRLSRSWRLDAQAPMVLGRVQVDGQPQLITRQSDASGVEVRHGVLSLDADSRIDGGTRTLPAGGWCTDLQGIELTLHLPPAWRLFAAPGADNVPDTWLSRWTLLDLFLVLVASIASLRLFGATTAALTLAALALTWHEPGAPRWSWLHLIAVLALLSAMPASFDGGRLRTVLNAYRWFAVGVLAFVAIPYAVDTARVSLYPQLENGAYGPPIAAQSEPMVAADAVAPMAEESMVAAVPAPAPPPPPVLRRGKVFYDAAGSGGASVAQSSVQRLDPNVLTQTGPGLPQWTWREATLSWGGPVTADQTFRLLLIPPWLTRLLGWLSIALVAVVAMRWLGAPFPRLRRPGTAAASLGALGLALALAGLPQDLRAQDVAPDEPPAEEAAPVPPPPPMPPAPGILDQLRDRLTAAPDCAPGCASMSRLSVTITGDKLVLRAGVDAAIDVGVPLPVPPVAAGEQRRTWQPQTVLVDDRPADLARDERGTLWVRVPAGRRTIAVAGSLVGYSQLQLPMPLAPHRVEVNASGWSASGIDADGRPGGAIDLARERAEIAAGDKAAAQTLPALFTLSRTLRLGLVWSAESTLTRQGGGFGASVVNVPLLPGETVTGDGVRVVDGRVQAAFAPGQESLSWTSRLATVPEISLKAADGGDLFEIWRFDVSPLWHVEFDGIAPVAHQEGDYWLATYRPWPGETVHAAVARPEGVKGQVLTLDRAGVHVAPGRRATDVTVTMALRASQGGQHAIPLPEGLALQSLSIDGQPQPARRENGRVIVPLHPGSQSVALLLRGAEGLGTRLRTPALDLGIPGVNLDLDVAMPGDRWILLAGGPRLGPAVLFWGVLAVMLAIAAALGRTGVTPLRAAAWALLMIGLSQLPFWGAAIVAGWFFALAARGHVPESWSARRFNAVQVVLALWTLAALVGLAAAVGQGLLGTPDMQIAGNGSSAFELRWYQDRFPGSIPTAWVLSVSIWFYRGLMLLWAMWLAWSLLAWLRWGWARYSAGGFWRKTPAIATPVQGAPPQ